MIPEEDPDVAAVVAIICATGRCEDCVRKARDVIATFARQHRLIPPGVEKTISTQWQWQHVRTGAGQTALVPQENSADWVRAKRRVGRWYGPWEQVEQ